MTGKVVLEYSNQTVLSHVTENGTEVYTSYTPIQVATAVSFMVGIFQVSIEKYIRGWH